MSWNNGYERRKFEQVQKAQAKEYRKCGMNEEQIQAMYLQDLQEYRNNRIYAMIGAMYRWQHRLLFAINTNQIFCLA